LDGVHEARAAGAGADAAGGDHRVEPGVGARRGVGAEAEVLAERDEGDPALVGGAGVGGEADEVRLLGGQTGSRLTVVGGGAQAGEVEGDRRGGRGRRGGTGGQERSSHGSTYRGRSAWGAGKDVRPDTPDPAPGVSLAGGSGAWIRGDASARLAPRASLP